eukprot:Nk52_evm46s1569 gene=Nk52_evmTU46s1569
MSGSGILWCSSGGEGERGGDCTAEEEESVTTASVLLGGGAVTHYCIDSFKDVYYGDHIEYDMGEEEEEEVELEKKMDAGEMNMASSVGYHHIAAATSMHSVVYCDSNRVGGEEKNREGSDGKRAELLSEELGEENNSSDKENSVAKRCEDANMSFSSSSTICPEAVSNEVQIKDEHHSSSFEEAKAVGIKRKASCLKENEDYEVRCVSVGNRNVKSFHCSYPGCDSSYNRLQRLEEHMRVHTGERPFVCPIKGCGRAYMRDCHLKLHMDFHSDAKRWKCMEAGCSSAFKTKQHLKRHVRLTHKKENPLTCHKCGSSFRKNRTYKVHLLVCNVESRTEEDGVENSENASSEVVSGSKRKCKGHRCPYPGCKFDFKDILKLERHCVRVHSLFLRGSLFLCGAEGCGEEFTDAASFAKHYNAKHPLQNESAPKEKKKLICPVCRKSYVREFSFNQHLNSHSDGIKDGLENMLNGERKFVCDVEGCGRGFTSKKGLADHKRRSHTNRTFTCDETVIRGSDGRRGVCGAVFRDQHTLKAHIARCHTNTPLTASALAGIDGA